MRQIGIALLLAACTDRAGTLPRLGEPRISGTDTIYPTIPSFSFLSQDSTVITEKMLENKIYVADFIFLACPTICPKMTESLRQVYERYHAHPDVYFLSHTIDPENDTPARLKSYSEMLGVDSRKWFFLTGDRASIYSLAQESYFTPAYADRTAPGGLVHGGGLLLIDKSRHIRGVYNGIDPSETKRLIADIARLLEEQEIGVYLP